MSDKERPYRQILRSTSIIGGASLFNIVVGLLRVKIAAILLGPAGVGVIGLLTNLVNTAAAVVGLGFSNVGTRQIAQATSNDNTASLEVAKRVLFRGTLILAFAGGAVFWLLRQSFATQMLEQAEMSTEIGWLAVAVILTVVVSSQSAFLNGTRRIGDLAKVNVFSALLATFFSTFALYTWGAQGLAAYVIAGPASAFVVGLYFVKQSPRDRQIKIPVAKYLNEWRGMIRIGVAFMVAGVITTLGQLFVRSLVQKELGSDSLGYFQAASTISMTYVGFVLTAMGTDYYPKLATVIKDQAAVNRMVNEQTEVALCLAGPVFLLMIALTPWVIDLLYSAKFAPAANILRLQVVGDILKIVSWPLGFVILAAGDGKSFVVTETIAIGVFILVTWLLQPALGVAATGFAFIGMYIAHLPLVYWLAHRRTNFVWDFQVCRHFVTLLFFALALVFLENYSKTLAAICGVLVGMGFIAYSCAVLLNKTGVTEERSAARKKIQLILSRIRGRHY